MLIIATRELRCSFVFNDVLFVMFVFVDDNDCVSLLPVAVIETDRFVLPSISLVVDTVRFSIVILPPLFKSS